MRSLIFIIIIASLFAFQPTAAQEEGVFGGVRFEIHTGKLGVPIALVQRIDNEITECQVNDSVYFNVRSKDDRTVSVLADAPEKAPYSKDEFDSFFERFDEQAPVYLLAEFECSASGDVCYAHVFDDDYATDELDQNTYSQILETFRNSLRTERVECDAG